MRASARSRRAAIDVRFVAATNRDLEAEVAARHASAQDLYFRLNGIRSVIPPLRDRVSEIAPLARVTLLAATALRATARAPELSRRRRSHALRATPGRATSASCAT